MLLTTLIALGLLQAAPATERAAVPPHRWTLDYGDTACTLARRVAGDGSPIVILHAPLGMEPGQLLVMDGGSGLDPRLESQVEVRLDQGDPLTMRARREQRSGGAVINLLSPPADFLDRVAGGRILSVSQGGEVILSLPLDDAREAAEALGRCNDELLQSWGVDLAARRMLSRKPLVTDFAWTFDVAPAGDAYVAFVANVSERGRPLDCRITFSTGDRRFNNAVCRTFRARARLEPALDAEGRPVAAQYVSGVRWYIRD